MESLAEAAEAAVGAAPQTRGEPALDRLDAGTDGDSSCAIVGEERVRSDAVTAMNNKKAHLRARLTKKIDLIEKAMAKSENKPLSTLGRPKIAVDVCR